MPNTAISRRHFLRQSGGAALSMAAVTGAAQLGAMARASAQPGSDYKALVCVLFAGGIDSYNMLVPTDSSAYAEYQATRTDLALPRETLLALDGAQSNGRTLGLHPRLTGTQNLYKQGKLAFLCNVGTLVEPTTTQALASGAAKLPLGLYSHSDQISQWQTALPDTRSATGWGGRMADLLSSQNGNQRISMSISTGGANEFQAGRATDSYTVTPGEGVTPALNGYGSGSGNRMNAALDEIYSGSYNNLLRRTYNKLFNDSLDANSEFAQALQSAPALATQFAGDEFSAQLAMVARTIAANQTLDVRRQVFFVSYGGWDHHDEVINAMDTQLQAVDAGLSSFQSAMAELAMEDQVTTFTTSDFARTLSSNGRGSDHGWGGNSIIMGGAVRGGASYGDYPSLALGNPLDTGRGVLMPTLSLDEYFAELALWFGVSPGMLADVLPNIGRFYSVGGSNAPVGFMM